MTTESFLIYGATAIFCLLVVWFYIRKGKSESIVTLQKIEIAKQEGRFEPLSLHPYVNLNACIGSGACIKACPEQDILGLVDGKATVINATNCIGHGACFHACPVEAISLRIGTEKRGVELPHVNQNYETNVKGLYIAGELGGMGLIKNSVEQGKLAVENIFKNGKPRKEGILDLAIIGAGPAGISGSLTAKKLGLSFVTLEQDSLGGTVFTFPRSKVVMTNPMDLPLYGKVKLFDTSKEELLHIWNDALGKNKITIQENTKIEGIVPMTNDTFKLKATDGREIIANHVLIAIGRRGSPRKLNIPGEESTKVAYRLLEPERIEGKKIMVVGGGDSAVESAMLLMEKNEVILSYRKDQFARIKAKNSQQINEAIKNNKLQVAFNSELLNIEENEVLIKLDDSDPLGKSVPNDLVYIFIGGELPTQFLKNVGINITKRFGQIVKKH
jgi:thioredoxin reductase/Pyruvate/2-oxoacid:ferredoxin oxidoreductase delta subunit